MLSKGLKNRDKFISNEANICPFFFFDRVTIFSLIPDA